MDELMLEEWGPRCGSYCPGCSCCQAWRLRDEAMVMHGSYTVPTLRDIDNVPDLYWRDDEEYTWPMEF